MPKKQKTSHYINNKEFYSALVDYKVACEDAKEKNLPRPIVTKYLGECFLKIATHLSYRPNFCNYPFKYDMISDAVENQLTYVHNFDPYYVNPKTGAKRNPFAYFTQICYFAFIRRIGKEKKQMEIKEKLLDKCMFDEVFTADEYFSSSDYNSIKDEIHNKLRY
jgi:hypothetical protein